MASGEDGYTALADGCYDDPSQLSQLLRQRAGSGACRDDTRPCQPLIEFTASPVDALWVPAPQTTADDEGHNSPSSRRVPIDLGYVQPNLFKQHSAPVTTAVDLKVQGHATQKMFYTFGGAIDTDVPGDTQPDSQMFRQYTSGILDSHSNIVPEPQTEVAFPGAASPDLPTDEIEVRGSSQSRRSPTITSPTVLNDENEIRDPLTSPLKFETPAVAGRKRDSQGQVLSSSIGTTPITALSASAIFGFGNTVNGNGMSLTQAFNATQARTSPMVGIPTEDPVFQRPSPNFVRRSSPPITLSSPIKNNAKVPTSSPALRSSSEPRTDYESMKQSQERRSHGPPHTISIGRQDSWDLPTAAEIRFNNRREKRMQKEQAAKSLAVVSAPSRANRRGRKPRTLLTSKTKSPLQNRSTRRAIYDGPQDSEDDNSPDELSQDILPSSSAARDHTGQGKKSGAQNCVQVPNTSSHPRQALSGQSSRNLSQTDTPVSQKSLPAPQFKTPTSTVYHQNLAKLKSSKESDIVMDSQPDPEEGSPTPPHPNDLRIPSTPSTNHYSINQTTMNGHTGFTSQVPPSSVPPMPPLPHVLEEIGEEVLPENENARVPSSPPILEEREGSVIYDEHAYEEHPNDAYGTGDAHPTQEDVDMEDDDDFPIAAPDKREAVSVVSKDGQYTETPISAEVPETMEQEDPIDVHNEEEELIRSSHPEDNTKTAIRIEAAPPPRLQRQSTVPETDVLEDTQPSFSPLADATPQHGRHVEGSTVDTNSTSVFHTGKEHQSVSKESADVQSPQMPVARSLLEIANQPGTQRSTEPGDIDLPQLSFMETDDSTDPFLSRSSPLRVTKKRKITYSAKVAFHSPAKDRDVNPGSSVNSEESASKPTSTASSTPIQDQEQLGALAAARAREQAVYAQPAATLKSRAPLKRPHPDTPQKGALKPVSRSLLAKTSSKLSPRSSKQVTAEPPTQSTALSNAVEPPKGVPDSTNRVPNTGISSVAIESASNEGEAPSGELLSPNRVFAYWPGRNYYPATCLKQVNARCLRIRYDDGNEKDLEVTQVRALDLCLGDQVKVDQTGMKKHTYIIVGFKDKISADDVDEPHFTDRRGYVTVVLEEKTRDSLPAAETKHPQKYYYVPMRYVYLTTTLWGRLRDRIYTYSPKDRAVVSDPRASTPTATHGSVLLTPTMSRRSVLGQSLLRDSTTRGASVASSIPSNGMAFTNMAFAITLTKPSSDKDDKDSIVRLITSNGGMVFEGFDELLDPPTSSADACRTTPALHGLLLKREYKDLHFVALISDAHSRRLKYLQALALNIPTIHTRWVNDSLNASCALPFARYLLPSGVSTHLDPSGVIISRNMPLYDPASEGISFVQMLKERPLLLSQQSVLFITGKSKADMDKIQPSIFLTHALGPRDVGQCKDTASARQMLGAGEWDWVYVHGGAKGVEDAAAALFGGARAPPPPPASRKRGAAAAAARKRRKDDEGAEPQVLVRSGEVQGKKVRVACDEFVIQSLILGSLVE